MDNSDKSPAAAAAAAATGKPPASGTSPAAATASPQQNSQNAAPEIETLPDVVGAEAYTPPPKPVEKKLKRRRRSLSKKLKAEQQRRKGLQNRREMRTRNRDSDIVAESAPNRAESVPVEHNDKATPDSEASEDYLNRLLSSQSVPDTPLLDEEGNPMEEDLSEAQPLVRVIKAVSNLVAYLMDHPLVPVAIGVALLIVLTGKL